MALRINNNISSINTQRQLVATSDRTAKTLEKLSSGLKINRGADGPASLVISERLRAQIAGLNQAIDNSETGISLVQTTESALDEVSRMLVSIRQRALHAANEGVNDTAMLEADQQEIDNAIATINRIAKFTRFGTKNLLDGSRSANGVASGEFLEFVRAGVNTKTSPFSGYEVDITQAATRSSVKGKVALTQEIIDRGESLTIAEGGKTLNFTTIKGESVESNMNALDVEIRKIGLNVELVRDQSGILHLRHKEYGSENEFFVSSATAGILSDEAKIAMRAKLGEDVAGSINGEQAEGKGQFLTGVSGTKNVEGLTLRYTGEQAPATNEEGEREKAGRVSVYQNSLIFQIGGNVGMTSSVSLKNMNTVSLGRNIDNQSGFKSLTDVDVRTFQGSQDAIILVDKALEEVARTRGDLGAFQKNNLQSNLNYLRNAHENLVNSESVLRDADMAREMADFTRNQIMMQSGTAMLAQANQTPQAVLSLLN